MLQAQQFLSPLSPATGELSRRDASHQLLADPHGGL